MGLSGDAVRGVIAALKEAWPEIPVYDERVEQGLAEPSFFVRAAGQRQGLFLHRRYRRRELIEVTYFPPREGRYADTREVLEALFRTLELIRAGEDLLRGSDMEARVDPESETGIFTVAYRYFAAGAGETSEVMETVESIGVGI